MDLQAIEALAWSQTSFQDLFTQIFIEYCGHLDEFFETMESNRMRLCFVTVGATASFERLVRQVLNEPFLAQLAKYQYTHLMVQYGKDGTGLWEEFGKEFPRHSPKLHGITVGGFNFRPDLWQYMRLAVKEKHQELGLVISHAGTGTILDALRLALPLIIVPNPDLADNHQEDLAIEMENMRYAIRADVDDLLKALGSAERQTPQLLSRPYGTQDSVAGLLSDQLQNVD